MITQLFLILEFLDSIARSHYCSQFKAVNVKHTHTETNFEGYIEFKGKGRP